MSRPEPDRSPTFNRRAAALRFIRAASAVDDVLPLLALLDDPCVRTYQEWLLGLPREFRSHAKAIDPTALLDADADSEPPTEPMIEVHGEGSC